MQNAFINKLNTALANIDAGNYAYALDQLQNGILLKTDGCAASAAVDKNVREKMKIPANSKGGRA